MTLPQWKILQTTLRAIRGRRRVLLQAAAAVLLVAGGVAYTEWRLAAAIVPPKPPDVLLQKAYAGEDLLTDAYLGVPTVTRRPGGGRLHFQPRREGMLIEYVGNNFTPTQNDMLYVLKHRPKTVIPAVDAEPKPLEPDERFVVLGDANYDFQIGVSFVPVRRLATGTEGFLAYETFFGECRAVAEDGSSTVTRLDAVNLVLPFSHGDPDEDELKAYETKPFTETLNAGLGDQVHPVFSSCKISVLLCSVLVWDLDEETDARILRIAERYFDEYVFPDAVEFPGGALAWPSRFDWPVHWGINLRAPWYGSYANATIAFDAAMMYHFTKDPKYRDLAKAAVKYLQLPMAEGGAYYTVDGFPFLAEYAYPSPPLPNLRVVDGELIACVCLANTATLLGDSEMLALTARVTAGLSATLPDLRTSEDFVRNAAYPWVVDNEGYLNCMRLCCRLLADFTKDRGLREEADRWKLAAYNW